MTTVADVIRLCKGLCTLYEHGVYVPTQELEDVDKVMPMVRQAHKAAST